MIRRHPVRSVITKRRTRDVWATLSAPAFGYIRSWSDLL